MTEIPQYKIGQFNSKHDVTEDQQFKALVEEVEELRSCYSHRNDSVKNREVGELAEVYNRDTADERVAEELADVLFVARSLAELRDINVTAHLNDVIAENNAKNSETDGQKVTKDTVEQIQ